MSTKFLWMVAKMLHLAGDEVVTLARRISCGLHNAGGHLARKALLRKGTHVTTPS